MGLIEHNAARALPVLGVMGSRQSRRSGLIGQATVEDEEGSSHCRALGIVRWSPHGVSLGLPTPKDCGCGDAGSGLVIRGGQVEGVLRSEVPNLICP